MEPTDPNMMNQSILQALPEIALVYTNHNIEDADMVQTIKGTVETTEIKGKVFGRKLKIIIEYERKRPTL